MATPRPFKSLAEQIADLDDPARRDIDPEEFGGPLEHRRGSDSSAEDVGHENAREHYEDVGVSKLRQPQQPSLGPRYDGLRIGREDLLVEEESDDDPFGSGVNRQGGMSQDEDIRQDEDAVVDPDEVDVDMATGGEAKDEDIDSDKAFGEGDEEAFKRFTFRGSAMPRDKTAGSGKTDDARTNTQEDEAEDVGSELDAMHAENTSAQDDRLDGNNDPESDADSTSHDSGTTDDDDDELNNDSDASSTGDPSPSNTPLPSDRAALRQMMAEEQTTVLATITRAAKADVAKGRAVQRQRSTFDTLLNTRIHLQKALIATNSLSAIPPPATPPPTTTIHAAETAALAFFSSLSSLLHSLHPSLPSTQPATRTTPTSALASTVSALSAAALPPQRATLAKWAAKTNLPLTLPPRSRLAPSQGTQPLLSVLDTHLSAPNLPRLLTRTRLPRSCAPLQAQSAATTTTASDPSIFDDADFYALLLRELVERKMATSTTGGGLAAHRSHDRALALADAGALTRAAKVRKKVDTKASKGRKMRYTVMERLQNFMARQEGGGWTEERVGELFGGLLGRRVVGGLGEGEGDGVDGDEDGGGDGEEGEGLRLFGGGV
ncbi:rRNA-processing protein bfr2 [Xylographa opegraphella]|nr:rRNA-processing protein bfr2 [Xylographa opegraphella]